MGTITLVLDEVGVGAGAIGTLGVSPLCRKNSCNALLAAFCDGVSVHVGASCTLGATLLCWSCSPCRICSIQSFCISMVDRVGTFCTLGAALLRWCRSMSASCDSRVDAFGTFGGAQQSCSINALSTSVLDCMGLFKRCERRSCSMTG